MQNLKKFVKNLNYHKFECKFCCQNSKSYRTFSLQVFPSTSNTQLRLRRFPSSDMSEFLFILKPFFRVNCSRIQKTSLKRRRLTFNKMIFFSFASWISLSFSRRDKIYIYTAQQSVEKLRRRKMDQQTITKVN